MDNVDDDNFDVLNIEAIVDYDRHDAYHNDDYGDAHDDDDDDLTILEAGQVNTAHISRQICQRRECKIFQLRGIFSY